MKNKAKRFLAMIIAIASSLSAFSCADKKDSSEETPTNPDKAYLDGLKAGARTEFNNALDLSGGVFVDSKPECADIVFDGETDAEYTGNVKISDPMIPGYAGEAYLEGLFEEGDEIIFTAEIPESGTYDLVFSTGMQSTGTRSNYVNVDGQSVGEIVTVSDEKFNDSVLPQVFLEKGTRKISITPLNGYIWVDTLTIKAAGSVLGADNYNIEKPLSNPNACRSAVNLYNFLCDAYGQYTISGTYCDDGAEGSTMGEIYKRTDKYPAMLGLDLMEYSPSRVEKGGSEGSGTIEHAMDWWITRGGIVTLCWHWNAPTQYLVNSSSAPWYKGFYNYATTLNLDEAMSNPDGDAYKAIISDIDSIAAVLKRLSDAGVPVLWRPLHEAGGSETSSPWFWWGDCKPESYIALWNLLYDRLTNVHGINNLIWVWNGQKASYYPGDETVDIIGYDIYAPEHSYSSQSNTFIECTRYSEKNTIVALTENGVLIDPDLAFRDNARWSWFCTWESFMTQFGIGTEKNSEFSMWEKVYQSEKVLTLDELPDIANYDSIRK